MNVCSYTDLREHLRERLDQVHRTRTPLLVTRQNAPSAILIDKEEFDGIMETLHLLRSPANANGCCGRSPTPMPDGWQRMTSSSHEPALDRRGLERLFVLAEIGSGHAAEDQ